MTPAPGVIGSVEWVLARPLCRFRIFDLAKVPKGRRRQALDLELKQWSPYPRSGYYAGWREGLALVWCWDEAAVEPAIAAQRVNPKYARVLPESVLQAPLEDGMRLVQCAEGFEGQLWRAGRLEHSRWWPRMPAADEWLSFQRDGSVQPEAQQPQPPSPLPYKLEARPWIAAGGLGGGDPGMRYEHLAVAAGIVALTLPTVWHGLSLYKLEQFHALRRAELAQLRSAAEPVLSARGAALEHLARIQGLRGLAPYPEQLYLMAKVAEALPKDSSHIREWSFQQGQLRITITSPNVLSSSDLVTALQTAGPFRDVKALAGQDARTAVLQMAVTASGS